VNCAKREGQILFNIAHPDKHDSTRNGSFGGAPKWAKYDDSWDNRKLASPEVQLVLTRRKTALLVLAEESDRDRRRG
jgi:hypothetical protein